MKQKLWTIGPTRFFWRDPLRFFLRLTLRLTQFLSVFLFLLLSLPLCLTGCTAPRHSQTEEQVSTASPAPWETAEIFLSYATAKKGAREASAELTDTLLDASDGRIYCNSYPGGKLGDDAQLMQAAQNGSISLLQCSTSVQVEQIPQLALLDIPYLFQNQEHCNRCLNERLMEYFQPYYNEAGLQLIAWHCLGFRQMTSNTEIKDADDLLQIRMRTLENTYHRLYWSSLGVETISVDFTNLFYSLQQRMVNAQENTVSASVAAGLDQVQDYLLLTNHVPFISAIVMNKESYDDMSAQDQKLLSQIFLDYLSSSSLLNADEEPEKYFTHVTAPTESLTNHLEQGAQVVRDALTQELGSETADTFYAIIKDCQNGGFEK